MTNATAYEKELARRIDDVFRRHPELPDHRTEHGWLTGSLGQPTAPVWFISEAHSDWRVARADSGNAGPHTPEDQWNVSPGDKRFRDALVKARLKDGSADAPGGWHCYSTVLSKSGVHFSEWRGSPPSVRLRLFETWAPVLAWQLSQGRPKVIAAMGVGTAKVLRNLVARRLIELEQPPVLIWNYGYLMKPGPKGSPPMDPERIRAYEAQVARVAQK